MAIAVGSLVALALGGFLFLGVLSRRQRPETGMVKGRLRPCPAKPNCVSSEDEDKTRFIEPFPFRGSAEDAWIALKDGIRQAGGVIERDTSFYIWATFRTRVMGFVDDVELRLDAGRRLIHVRSASRVGYSDLGANRRRVEALRRGFAGIQESSTQELRKEGEST
jgi:uncharacterized protein (DUF1499 family)